MRNSDESDATTHPVSNHRLERRSGESSPLSSFDSVLVVSNRQPYRHEFVESSEGSGKSAASDGGTAPTLAAEEGREVTVDTPSGGLTAGLDPVLQRTGGTWIAWGDGDADRFVTDDRDCVRVPPAAPDGSPDGGGPIDGGPDDTYTLRRIWLTEDELDAYYYGFSNRVLWPLCHERPELVEDRPGDFEGYRDVNRRFAAAAADHASANSLVWLQDYHFGLAPSMLREKLPPSTTLGQFWHVPWPRPDVFQQCPHGRELLVGLLGNDLLGFHVDRWADAFLACVDRFLPAATVDRSDRTIHHDGATTRVASIPMGVDARDHDRTCRGADPGCYEAFRSSYDVPEDVALGVGVDRLDYSKGIPQRLAAIERLFERQPGWRESFTYVQVATPSRTDIPTYAELGAFVRSEVDRINDRFGTDRWNPVVYTEDYLSRETLCALYRRADAMLVSPLLDGMNLVAQEYVASSVDGTGALVLSERAGAHDLLGDAAYSIDPGRTDAFAETLDRALSAPPAEHRRRMQELRCRVFDHDLDWWMHRQFEALAWTANDPATEASATGRPSGDRQASRTDRSGRSIPR